MPKITDYGALGTTAPDDVVPIVDVHDTSMAATGTTKKITVANLTAGAGGPTLPLVIGQGGTGQTTQQAALDALAGGVTGGQVLRGNGTHVTLAALQAGDIPLDGTAADITPVGLQAAGGTGKAADAGHVHPNQGYQFLPTAYGAKGDGKVVMDGAITTGTNTLVCATSTPFVPGDVGKTVIVNGAGVTASVSALATTISGYTSSSTVTLAANAATTASAAAVMWGTDDTAAFQSAVTAAVAWMGTNYQAEVYIPPAPGGLFYMIAGALQTTGTGNAQILIPTPSNTAAKQVLKIKAYTGSGSVLPLWSQTVPHVAGALVSAGLYASTAAYTTNYTSFGDSAVIGCTPSATSLVAAIGGLPAFANMLVVCENLVIVGPSNSQGLNYTAINLAGAAMGEIRDCSALITTNYNTSSGPNAFPATGNMANGRAKGFVLPGGGNNDQCAGHNLTCSGYSMAFTGSEHALFYGGRAVGCWSVFAIVSSSWNQAASEHIFRAVGVSGEKCTNVVWLQGVGAAGHGFFANIEVDIEPIATLIQDATSGTGLGSLYGEIRVNGNFNLSMFPTKWPTLARLIAVGNTAPGWVFGYTGFSTAGTGVAVQNPYWRDARVYVSGGTVTAISAGVTLGGTGGSATTAPTMTATGLTAGVIDWPSGGWLSITQTVSPTVNVCVS